MFNRLALERSQVWLYLSAILGGLLLGSLWADVGPVLEALLWPVLALLLYAAFMQVDLLHLRQAFTDRRFIMAALIGNFVILPGFTWALVQWLPAEPALRLGVLLVLLVPCTDWFVTFAQLGRGDLPRAIAITPLNLVLQLVLLPFYLWLMWDGELSAVFGPAEIWPALLVVLVPLIATAASQRLLDRNVLAKQLRDTLAWWPVPLLAVVLFMVAGAQADSALSSAPILVTVVPVFAAFLVGAALLARVLTYLLKLPMRDGRTLAFSFSTRNSFVVLPVALALPEGWEPTALVIIMQSLVELFGMVVYLWWLPNHLFKSAAQRTCPE